MCKIETVFYYAVQMNFFQLLQQILLVVSEGVWSRDRKQKTNLIVGELFLARNYLFLTPRGAKKNPPQCVVALGCVHITCNSR